MSTPINKDREAWLLRLQERIRAAHDEAHRLESELIDLCRTWHEPFSYSDTTGFGPNGLAFSIRGNLDAARCAAAAAGTSLDSLDWILIGIERSAGGYSLPIGPTVHQRVAAQDAEIREAIVGHEPCENEGCHLPACREERDRLSQLGASTLHPADHPKANPVPDERELAHAWEC